MRKRCAGFGAIEFLVTVTIIAILAVAAAAGMQMFFAKNALKQAQAIVVDAVKEARGIARSRSTVVTVTLARNGDGPATATISALDGTTSSVMFPVRAQLREGVVIKFFPVGTADLPASAVFDVDGYDTSAYVDILASGQVIQYALGHAP